MSCAICGYPRPCTCEKPTASLRAQLLALATEAGWTHILLPDYDVFWYGKSDVPVQAPILVHWSGDDPVGLLLDGEPMEPEGGDRFITSMAFAFDIQLAAEGATGDGYSHTGQDALQRLHGLQPQLDRSKSEAAALKVEEAIKANPHFYGTVQASTVRADPTVRLDAGHYLSGGFAEGLAPDWGDDGS